MAHALGAVTRVASMLLQIVLMPGLWIETSRGWFIVVVAKLLLRLLALAVGQLLPQKLLLVLRLLLSVIRRYLTCCVLWSLWVLFRGAGQHVQIAAIW